MARVDDKLQTNIDRPYASRQDHAKAYAYLRRRHTEGTLLSIEDWDGEILDGYVSILGVQP